MGKIIAVVEDEPFIAEVLEFLLAGVDRQVKLLRSGEEARRFFSHSQLTGEDTPALVVLDLMMPTTMAKQSTKVCSNPEAAGSPVDQKQLFSPRLGKRRSRKAVGIRCRSIYHQALFQRGAVAEVDRLCG